MSKKPTIGETGKIVRAEIDSMNTIDHRKIGYKTTNKSVVEGKKKKGSIIPNA